MLKWLDERTGWSSALVRLGQTPVPGGARWSYVFGSALALTFLVQAVTGLLLANFYAPSSTTAWASVAYLQREVTLGWLIRGLHSSGASMMVVLVALHLLQVVVWGAYRAPREVNWWLGLVLMALVFAFALTGYLLPWDQKGFWATQVATSLLGETPLVGDWLRRVIQGGGDYGNLTLTHFYALHTILLPGTLTVFVVVHVRLMRRHGVTPLRASGDSQPFWPHQALRDVTAMAIVVAIMFFSVLRTHGAPLEAPADPSSAYDARPEWYFVPLFQLLKYFPGRLESIGALGVPSLIGAVLFALPRFSRRAAAAVVLTILGGAAGLSLLAHRDDARNEGYRRGRARADADAKRALELAALGVPPAGGTAVFDNDPERRVRQSFETRCAGCHVLDGVGEERAPLLTGWSSRAWLTDFLKQPDAAKYFGKTKKLHGMKPVKPVGDELNALVEWIFAQGGGDVDAALVARGETIWTRESCDDCHSADGKSEGVSGAPNLAGRGTLAWIEGLIRDGGGPLYFSDHNEMPRFGADKLSDEDVAALARLIAAGRTPK
ncbi:MAG: Cytochrome b/b6 domain protein [Myxococcales bacterium]|nr:Cytochrome b/b6 domain protein [Myxococcales bacterium]